MTPPAIQIRNLSKRYHLGSTAGLRHTLPEAVEHAAAAAWRRLTRGMLKGTNPGASETSGDGASGGGAREFWALRDVSFDVAPGEVVGIVGRNGAGKSTLLKVLSQITEPTAGSVLLRGRVASLLEVGTGFHPELTGRENIYLNGSMLGMSRKQIKSSFGRIVEFAEIGPFLDTPVKRYSSGMYVRLAFAVAAHLEPEVLIVDEVLAVGDAQFQRKCLGRMSDVARTGRTVLFVSHNMRAVRTLCTSGVYLKGGRLDTRGGIDLVAARYCADAGPAAVDLPHRADELTVHGFAIRQQEQAGADLDGSAGFEIDIDFELARAVEGFRVGVYIQTAMGDTLLRSFIADWDPRREALAAGRRRATLRVPGALLMPGGYSIILHASRFGLRDYLGQRLCHRVTVGAPDGFNRAHMSESIESMIILDQPWSITQETTPCRLCAA